MKVIVVTAPSGSGKTTIVHALMKDIPQLAFSVSATTREPRKNEQEGKDYYFLSAEIFQQKIAAGEFLEYEEVYSGRFYGTLKEEINRLQENNFVVVFDIEVHGAMNIKELYGDDCLTLFIKPPSLEVLKKRLIARGSESPDRIKTRLEKARYELSFESKFDTIVMNDALNLAIFESKAVVNRFLG